MPKALLAITGLIAIAALFAAPASGAARAAPAAGSPPPAIRVDSHADRAVVRCPVALLRGTLADAAIACLQAVNESATRAPRQITGSAYKGRFVVPVELVPGRNRIALRAAAPRAAQRRAARTGHRPVGPHPSTSLRLTYKPQTNPYVVRVVYLTDRTGETAYQTPLDDDPQNYQAKLDTALKLMQAFTAERMNALGFGRATFRLELDPTGKVRVHTLRCEKTAAELRGMSTGDLYRLADRLVRRQCWQAKARYLVVPAFTRFDVNAPRGCPHPAMGGDALALIGGGNLFTWPNGLDDVRRAFTDTHRIDARRYFSDSAGRHTFWAAAATTMGAALHELGHTFGAVHVRDPYGIMARGIDHLNRAFTLVEPRHAGRATPYAFPPDQTAVWAPATAAWLRFSRWFALDKRRFSDENLTAVRLERRPGGQTVVVHSPHGIGAVILASEGVARAHLPAKRSVEGEARSDGQPPRPPGTWPKTVELPLSRYGEILREQTAAVRVIDTQGNARAVRMKVLRAGPFVRDWRFAPVTLAWPDKKAFVNLSDARRAEIAAAARKAPLVTSPTPVIDLAARLAAPPNRPADLAGYAVRTLRCRRARKIRILAGSDDALRVWVNGRPVIRSLALRPAETDQDTALVALRRGDNTLLVEVSQAAEGWYLCLRLEDPAGHKLLLTKDGRLQPAR